MATLSVAAFAGDLGSIREMCDSDTWESCIAERIISSPELSDLWTESLACPAGYLESNPIQCLKRNSRANYHNHVLSTVMSTLAELDGFDIYGSSIVDGDDHRKIVANIMANWDYVVRSTGDEDLARQYVLERKSLEASELAFWEGREKSEDFTLPRHPNHGPRRNRSTRSNVFCQLYDHGLDSGHS